MKTEQSREQQLLLWALLLSSLIGISIWYIQRLAATPVREWGSATVVTFSYFTNFSNGMIIVMAAALLWGRGRLANWFQSASVQSAFCLYIAFVGLGFWFLLGGPGELDSVIDWIPQLTAHTLSPVLGAVYFWRVVPKGKLTWRDPFVWLIYPVAYLVYWLFRGPRVGYYPYFFIDVNALGYAGVAAWSGALMVVLLILGGLMVLVNRRGVA
ncbi:MAG: hypothetical protein D6706_18650 [Chloroflexi bacterium]|nr:MAG: hypothetical protein D6706_18650 [Chloroflexota bacterium]